MTRPLTPAEEAIVQQSAALLVTPDIPTMRRVAASINDAFDRAAGKNHEGMTEALRACAIDDANRKQPWAERTKAA